MGHYCCLSKTTLIVNTMVHLVAQHAAPRRGVSPAPTHATRSIACRAANKQGLKVDPDAKRRGFKWDPANSRWIRDDRVADTAWENNTVVRPLSGPNYIVWPVMHSVLLDNNLQSLKPDKVRARCCRAARANKIQAQAMVDAGKAVLLDIRTTVEHERQHIPGSVFVPLYSDVQGTTFFDNLKRVVMAVGFAMRATGAGRVDMHLHNHCCEPQSATRSLRRRQRQRWAVRAPPSSCTALGVGRWRRRQCV